MSSLWLQLIEEWSEKLSSEDAASAALQTILEHEMLLLESLKGGDALAQHMEDFYLESLCKLVATFTDDDAVAAVLQGVREKLQRWREAAAAANAGDGECS